MSDIEKGIMDYTKKELTDYVNKVEDIIISIDPSCFGRPSSGFYVGLPKSKLAGYCESTASYLLDLKVERHFTFFWKDGTSDSIKQDLKQDLYKIIGEKDELFVDNFIDTDYFDLFWEDKIGEYKVKLVDCELFKYSVSNDKVTLNKEEVIKKWNEYKDKHPKVDLLDDDELF